MSREKTLQDYVNEYQLAGQRKTIYLVTQGTYADYIICAAFSDEKVAEALTERLNNKAYSEWDEARVESCDVDDPELVAIARGEVNFYWVVLNRDGDVREITELDTLTTTTTARIYRKSDGMFAIATTAPNPDAAAKKARELLKILKTLNEEEG